MTLRSELADAREVLLELDKVVAALRKENERIEPLRAEIARLEAEISELRQ